MQKPLLVYADDSTGALEVAAATARYAYQAQVHTHLVSDYSLPDNGCLVINGNSRHLRPAEINANNPAFSYLATQLLENPSAQLLHKMDSTLRGNWAHEIRCLAELSGKKNIVLIPAFPAHGRLCIDGMVSVHGELVHHTPMANDPLCPIFSSEPKQYLEHAGLSNVQVATDSPASITDWVQTNNNTTTQNVLIAQVRNQQQFDDTINNLKSFNGILAGPSSVAAAIASQYGIAQPKLTTAHEFNLIICGSMHPTSQQQLHDFAKHHPTRVFDVQQTPDDNQLVALLKHNHVILKTDINTSNPDYGLVLQSRVRKFLSLQQANNIQYGILVIGGETLGSLQDPHSPMLGLGEIATGIPLSKIMIENHQFTIMSKAGAFGDKDFLSQLLAQ